MYLDQGWLMFTRWRNIQQSQCLLFRYDGQETLWVKVFHPWGTRVSCCAEEVASSSGESGTGNATKDFLGAEGAAGGSRDGGC